ncbi:MAG: thiaminase II [Candidatus Binatia bacterium]
MRLTERLRKTVEPIWEAQRRHPFVRGIADGTLSRERFQYWIRQDYAFLVEYARLLALAAARSPDLETMGRFASLLSSTLETEMSMHRAYAAELGIGAAELEATRRAPTCQAYTDFLVRTAAAADFVELVGAMLPCMWGFSEIGRRLAEEPHAADSRYARWIEMYADPAFADLAEWCRGLLDRLAEGLSERELRRIEAAFVTSSRFEWRFWEMCWQREDWEV